MGNVKVEGSKAPSRRNRTAMSCDKCKSRKTKCNNPVPGPCDYCRSVGATCNIDAGKRKQRPYYFVSEEQYQHMAKLVKHHYGPNVDLETLRSLTANLNDGNDSSPTDPSTSSPNNASPKKGTSSHVESAPGSVPKTESPDGVPLEDIDSLHEQLGCMMQDSTGEYRYMSAVTGFSFNAAVRDLHPSTKIARGPDRDVIPPMKTMVLPPATPQSPAAASSQIHIRMPPKALAYHYVNRYFSQVHCLYWLYSTEQFHTRFENSYTASNQTASWACSLYSIFALASQRAPESNSEPDERTASDYLALAKATVPQVCDEADLDSIRALMLLATALQSHCYSTSAYLHVGIAVRIAQSLGLHMDKYSLTHGFVEREHSRRIWWTLYIYDAETSLRCGKPRAIVVEPNTRQAPLPSEQVLNPGPNMPSGYLEVSKSLTEMTEVTTQTLYVEPLSPARRLLSPKVTSILSSLQTWANEVPAHLSRTALVAPSHKRSVALLHVRYWSVVILATRPFLLCSVLRAADLDSPEKRRCYDELSNICIDAAQNSLSVLKMMSDEHILSSLLFSEFVYVLELVQCFLIAYSKTKQDEHIRSVRTCMTILKAMEEVGWVQKARPEVMLQLQELGIGEEGSESHAAEHLQDFSNFLIGEDSSDPYDMFFPNEQAGSYHFADMELPDHATADEMFAQISSLSMPQFLTP
ncbi:uncharacterized protein AB675_5719 [Cyphellophora attinorum]|uniref:Zn(2)-C6 fungal-type domain-containing protein n=1 Tax=Cyphellophora attinorum TaxID=1664694 RepID=A0A0N1H2I7_9EURO|nr:uncharacterized protein AB675_5719 [Phialophora attinorum]KPI38713.1 hypothetical protein AB675_5719 [Phialophora attinorum]